MVEAHIKAIYSHSGSTQEVGVRIHGTRKVIILRVDRCDHIEGVAGNLACWLSNNLRVFAPAVFSLCGPSIYLELPREGVIFSCEISQELPEMLKEFVLYKED